MQEVHLWSLGWEDALEKEMATHSSILPWEISWTEEPDRLQSMGPQKVGREWATEHMYMYNWFTLLSIWNQHITNQLYCNKKF